MEGLRWEAGLLTGSFKLMAPMDGYGEGIPDKVELRLLPEKEEMHGYASFVTRMNGVLVSGLYPAA